MREKINNLTLKCYIKACCAAERAKAALNKDIREFKDDERGLSGIVVAVLLIVIAVAIIAIFWEKLSAWFEETWNKITTDADKVGKSN